MAHRGGEVLAASALLAGITRVMPWLIPWAAAGLMIVMLGATILHGMRGRSRFCDYNGRSVYRGNVCRLCALEGEPDSSRDSVPDGVMARGRQPRIVAEATGRATGRVAFFRASNRSRALRITGQFDCSQETRPSTGSVNPGQVA